MPSPSAEVVRPDVRCWTLTPDGRGGRRTQEISLVHALEKALGLDQITLMATGATAAGLNANGGMTPTTSDATPRCWSWGYERNIWTNEKYDKAGITVLPIPGDELGHDAAAHAHELPTGTRRLRSGVADHPLRPATDRRLGNLYLTN